MATSEHEEGVVASAQPVAAHTLEEYERAVASLLDEMADLVPDGEPEDDVARAKREALELQMTDLLSREADKVDRTADVLRRFEREADACKEDADRLRKRSKTFDAKRSRLASYILDVMLRWGVKKLDGVKSSLTRIQNADTVEVDDATVLPFEFQRFTFTFRPRTQEEAARLHDMLAELEGDVAIEAEKKPLLDLVKRVDKETERALHSGEADIAPDLPDGVRLRPGTWRLAVR